MVLFFGGLIIKQLKSAQHTVSISGVVSAKLICESQKRHLVALPNITVGNNIRVPTLFWALKCFLISSEVYYFVHYLEYAMFAKYRQTVLRSVSNVTSADSAHLSVAYSKKYKDSKSWISKTIISVGTLYSVSEYVYCTCLAMLMLSTATLGTRLIESDKSGTVYILQFA